MKTIKKFLNCPAVFTGIKGDRLTYAGAYDSLKNYTRNSGIHMNFHKGRHTFANLFLSDCEDLDLLMETGGWLTVKSVIRYNKKSKKVNKELHRKYSPIKKIL
ncbi:tyrosine-type recombinase/integrase [Bacillus sp. MRMR6]|uniref:tyrosine-type recombinase/integrase n=1 Tax=Bacillus sp. MRMR6 TaxID=1928617 RepID=UPI0009518DD4|nr:hypothetical protein BTR25_13690 [Bacillus sp. MRMR6]